MMQWKLTIRRNSTRFPSRSKISLELHQFSAQLKNVAV